ncbi:MAG: alpha/beta hydrolase [Bacteroidetes bacterium]|nr:alpha/beta hydrolase [Bacteroidota bacterium]
MKILFCILASLLSLSTSVCQTGPTSYVLPRTEVVRLPSKIVGIDYLLYVSLPRDYNTTDKKYPLLVTLDADYAFALAHNIVDHFVDRNNLPPMIIVSIAYDSAGTEREVYRRHRTRDYTPTHTLEGGYGPEFQRHSGGAPGFLSFIEKEMLPFLGDRYRLDRQNRCIVGHSYGGLFSTFVLLTKPELFQKYIIVSPSLWYDDKVIFNLEKTSSSLHKVNAKVFFGVGSFENQPNVGRAMVDDMQELIVKLKSRAYSGLSVDSQVFDGETHNSVFPAALSRGLRVVFSGH